MAGRLTGVGAGSAWEMRARNTGGGRRWADLRVALTLLGIALAACGPAGAGDQPTHARTGGLVILALDAEPGSLNPLVAGDVSSVRAYSPMFPNLYQVDAHQVVSPDLAAAMPEISASGLDWTVRLRPGARWSDGKPMGADDVVYTVQTEANPDLDTRARFDWSPLAAVTRVDDTTVRFTLKAPDAAFLAEQLVMPVVPRHVLAQVDIKKMSQGIFGSTPSVSGGPFKFVRRTEGLGIELRANPVYYGGRAVIDTLREIIVRDPLSAADALANAQLTWDQGLTAAAADRVRGTVGVRVTSYPDLGLHDLRFNTRPGRLFGDVPTRQAVALTFDREALVRAATGGRGSAAWGFVSPTSWAFDSAAVTRYRQDTARATALLRGAGWAAGADGILARQAQRLSTSLVFEQGDPHVKDAARRVADSLRKVGIQVRPEELSRFGLQDRLARGDFDLALGSTGLGLDPDLSDFLTAPVDPAPGSAYSGTGYADPGLLALLQRERGLTLATYAATRSARREVFAEIERNLGVNLPSIPLWTDTRYQGVNTTLGGLDGAGNEADQDRNSRLFANLFLRS
ncbi:MAG: ABC transporter substrate-binding protein [Candidatus Dormibacteria bacterium]